MLIVASIAAGLCVIVCVFFFVLHPLVCIVECAMSKQISGGKKVVWILMSLVLGVIGSLPYALFATRSPRLNRFTKLSLSFGVLCLAVVSGIAALDPSVQSAFRDLAAGNLAEITDGQLDLGDVASLGDAEQSDLAAVDSLEESQEAIDQWAMALSDDETSSEEERPHYVSTQVNEFDEDLGVESSSDASWTEETLTDDLLATAPQAAETPANEALADTGLDGGDLIGEGLVGEIQPEETQFEEASSSAIQPNEAQATIELRRSQDLGTPGLLGTLTDTVRSLFPSEAEERASEDDQGPVASNTQADTEDLRSGAARQSVPAVKRPTRTRFNRYTSTTVVVDRANEISTAKKTPVNRYLESAGPGWGYPVNPPVSNRYQSP